MKLSIEAQLTIFVIVLILIITGSVAAFNYWLNHVYLASLLSLTFVIPLGIVAIRLYIQPINKILIALNDGFHNFIDNDFSVSLAKTRSDELGELVNTYNRVSDSLRSERLYIYQRELLLDTVIQSTPLSLLLVDEKKHIIYSNSEARKLFNAGKMINGHNVEQLLIHMPDPFSRAINSGLSGLFTVKEKDNVETYHITQNHFLLNNKNHYLYLFKLLTKEISRQEVNTWKKVIRLISHELNNSLAPISSLAHSGQLLSLKGDTKKLDNIFQTIEERAKYLQNFIEGYAKFARLPKPQIKPIDTHDFFSSLQKLYHFTLTLNNTAHFSADPSQFQQVLINLIKNADESGSKKDEIKVNLKQSNSTTEINILDRGKGMNNENLANALLPFYSTKSKGTGLGLPLCKEIIEAHGGKLLISNRKHGGLSVVIMLPG